MSPEGSAPTVAGAARRAATLRPLVQQSTPARVAARVRRAIANGDFPPGSQLHEVALARQLGVSRGPLREGLQRLSQEGLLTSIRNRGLFVVDLTPENVEDMFLAREAIERCAAAVLLRGDHVAAADALERVLDQMARAAEAGDSHGVAEADIGFHEKLVALTGSERLRRIHETQAAEARICVHALGSSYADDVLRVSEHRAIAQALRDGDAELTDRLLVAHMADAVRELVEASRNGRVARQAD
ncbi:GntR family transcriptional regulator [Ornithinimicrobium avium]|uniref:GntR family transcriptional regulator n=1 Tax=Ornithinimicrobium avium TaxID=2283195 RepID=UPI001D1806FE|nr:GntR family transcriptional regulator [Ornithinimicrobium avium]